MYPLVKVAEKNATNLGFFYFFFKPSKLYVAKRNGKPVDKCG